MAKKIDATALRYLDDTAVVGIGSSEAGDAYLFAGDRGPAASGKSADSDPTVAASDPVVPVVMNAFEFTADTLTYSENFDSLAATATGTGAAMDGGTQVGSTRFVFLEATGTAINTTYTAGTGSSNSGDTYSFGSTGSTDRALGSVASAGVATIYYGTLFTNNSGATITSLAISYTGEQWRSGGRSSTQGPDKLDFQYSTTATTIGGSGFTDFNDLDFVSLSALPATAPAGVAVDGNAAANRQALSATLAVNIPVGGSIFIRWVDTNVVGNDDGLAIDNFSITATTAAASPETIAFQTAAISQNEGSGADTPYTFTLTRTGNTSAAATVAYAIQAGSGTTTDANDFVGTTSGTATFAAGSSTATVTITVAGDRVVEENETFTLALSNPSSGYALSTTDAARTNTILNDDTAYAIAAGRGSEGGGTVPLVVTRTGDLSQAATLSYVVSLANGDTASANDFPNGVLPSGTVSFVAGSATATINVAVVDDVVAEPDETFTVTLSGAPTGQTITTASATGTIVDNDFPTLSIANANVIEGNDGTVALVFTVTSSEPAGTGGITFQASTADGTATAGSDYAALVGAMGSIAAGQTSTTVTVLVNGDTLFERNETLTITLSSANNAVVSTTQGTATGTIVNDDAVPASARIFATDFSGFTAAGFSPTPGTGQLDSNVFRVVGMSDNANPAYGATLTTGDFARGVINGSTDVTGGGTYSPSANAALVFQPTGSDFEPGYVETRILNNSGATAAAFDVAFDWAYRNSGGRGQALSLSYSTDGVNFTAYTQTNFTTPLTADAAVANVFTNQHETAAITATVADGGYLYLRFNNAGAGGTGNRDEIGIDNITVDARLSSTPTASIGDISVTEGNSGQTLATFTVTRSNGTTAASVDYKTVDGTATAGSDYVAQSGTVQFAVGETSKTISILVNGDTRNEANETFGVVLSNANGFVVPQPRATATILNDDTGAIAIYDIQGLGHTSGFAGQTVSTYGVVTALAANGFYLQDAVGDGNIGTSDGIFVLTTSAPTVAVGNAITLSGTVTEARGHTGALTLTQLANPTAITVTQEAATLPAAVVIATDGVAGHRAAPTQVIDDDGLTSYDPTTDGVDFYESLENMLVTIQTPRVVADTTSIGATYVVASDGAGATGLNSRSGMTISAGDANPETIQIFRGSNGVNYTQGDTLNDVTGVLTYFSNSSTSSGSYQVNPTATTTLLHDTDHPARETTALRGDASRLSYASFNVENLAPVPDSTVTDRNTQAKVDLAFARHAAEVVNALGSPDVIGLQEIQDADGIGTNEDHSGYATASKLIAAIQAAGGPTYVYVEVTPTASTGGEPNGFIRPGFLYNPERVSYVPDSARAITDAVYDGTRRPLVADFVFNGKTFTAIDLHSTSRGGSDPLYGSDQPPTQAGDAARTAQAQAAKAYIDNLLASDPNHLFVVNGDFNGFYYETALQALAPIDGTGALSNLILKLPSEERYTYYFDGYYQSFDNVIVSTGLYAGSSFDIVHYNAGYTDGLSATDHDQPVALIGLARGDGAATAIADRFTVTANAIYDGTVLANDTGGAGTLSVTAINGDAAGVGHAFRLASGAMVTLLTNGTFSYDPDGAFSTVAAGATATDSFSYAITGGSSATVTVTITGVTTPAPDANGHINGTAGNDSFGGTQGSDYFDLSAGGNDIVSGGAGGDDAYYFGAALTGADRIIGGSGFDEIGIQGDYTGANRLVLTPSTLVNVEMLAARAGFDYDIRLDPTVIGDVGKFTVYGGQLGADDNLTVDGSTVTGPLAMYGGLGIDTLTGGSGDDSFFFGPDRFGANDVVHGGAGSDQIGLDGSYTITLDARMDVETVMLLRGPESVLNTFVVSVADSFVETGGSRTISASTVANPLTIDASGERDGHLNIVGGVGNDTIMGGGTSDTIMGGAGADMLRGGGGADVFVYDNASQSTGRGYDTLLDFDYQSDRIQIVGQTHDIYANVVGGQLDDATFDADIQAAVGSQLVNGAAVFFTATSGNHAGETFLIVDANGGTGYQSGGDYVFHMATAPTSPTPDFIIA